MCNVHVHALSVCIFQASRLLCLCVRVLGHFGVWGELINHKTHYPSSQGWPGILFICVCVFVLFGCGVLGLDSLSSLSPLSYCAKLVVKLLKSLLWNGIHRFYDLYPPRVHTYVYNITISFGTQVKCMYYMYKTHLSNSPKS